MEPQLLLLGGLGSLVMGLTLGIFGAGGSILTVPILVFLFGFPASLATHYSLLVVGLVSGFGLTQDRRGAKLPILELVVFALPAMAGMWAMRRLLLPHFPAVFRLPSGNTISLDSAILATFALFMLAASLSMIFMKVKNASAKRKPMGVAELSGLAAVGALVGLATGLVGAGGGFLIVPALVFLAHLSVMDATRASLFVITLNSLWGFLSSPFTWSELPWGILAFVILLAFLGMALGLAVQRKLPAQKLKPAFGVFVLLMGSYVLLRAAS